MWRHPYDDMAKMAPVGGDGYGLYGDDDGLYLGPGVPLIAREVDADGIARFAVRPQAELDVLLHAAYGMEVDLSRRMSILNTVANAFEKGEWSRAMISAAHLRLPPLEGDAAVDCLRKVESLIKYNFNPNEPRDWHGRWTYASGGEARPASYDRARPDTGVQVAMADTVMTDAQVDGPAPKAEKEPSKYQLTPEQKALADAGKVEEFWLAREAVGDPMAYIALASLHPTNTTFDQLFGGAYINRTLQAYARQYLGHEIDLNKVRIDLMQAHAKALEADKSGILGILSPEKITEYHHKVFASYGLPDTAFGGTPLTGGDLGVIPNGATLVPDMYRRWNYFIHRK